jgi:molybdopterin synthase sulfur carrier subunit
MSAEVTVRYFAWVRERVGKAEERLTPPAEIVTVLQFLEWLKARGEEYDYALEQPAIIRVALDQMHAEPDDAIAGTREIALFPPMTGG